MTHSTTAQAPTDRRSWLRFRTILPVLLESPLYGQQRCIARNVSGGGICIELADPLPLGTELRVRFTAPNGTEIVAIGCVRNHYVFNYATRQRYRQLRGIGIRFTAFDGAAETRLRRVLDRMQVAH
ncbi:MAG: PilZ domain-containing protein [Deltaproteobacteria bacterium]|nr:PilZ domain-containing protein [Deltaproteobacteria bacterium]